MKKQQYCILNTQYPQTEYFELLEKIAAQMRDRREWGEFFPASIAPFPFNETTAFDYYPLTQAAAEALGYRWATEAVPPQDQVPHDPAVRSCEQCHRAFRVIKEEGAFYSKAGVDAPSLCPKCRTQHRAAVVGSKALQMRNCTVCGTAVATPRREASLACPCCYAQVTH